MDVTGGFEDPRAVVIDLAANEVVPQEVSRVLGALGIVLVLADLTVVFTEGNGCGCLSKLLTRTWFPRLWMTTWYFPGPETNC
jgi:hypothetical protein